MEVDTSEGVVPGMGERLTAYRESLGLSQEKFAALLGGTKRAIQNNEGGKASPNSKLLVQLARLGANINWLLTGEGPMLIADLAPRGGANQKPDKEAFAYAIEMLDGAVSEGRDMRSTSKRAEVAAVLYEHFQGLNQKRG